MRRILIENRENYHSIPPQAVGYIGREDVNSRTQPDNLALQPLKKQSPEDWANNTYRPPDVAPTMAENSDEESESEDSIGNGDTETNQIKTPTSTNINKAYNFLQKTAPVQVLIRRLRLLTLPSLLGKS